MKKIIAMVLALVLCLGAFVGCSYAEVDKQEKEEEVKSMFIQVEKTGSWKVLYHKETKVMYAVSYASYNCGTFTLLVNPDGTPQLWEGE